MGFIKTSIFDYSESPDEYRKEIRKYCLEYSDLLEGKTPVADGDKEKHMELLHEMAWLEHRRWNAYMRSMGFRSTCKSEYSVYAAIDNKGSYKQMDLKLHPCLVECDKKGI
jgi:hypothetical protein